MARNQGSSAMGARSQRVNQARFGDITVRYGKDKRSNMNRKVPTALKIKKASYNRRGSMNSLYSPLNTSSSNLNGSSSRKQTRIDRENSNMNRITLSRFIRWSLFITVLFLAIWGSTTTSQIGSVRRQRRSITEIISNISNKYVPLGYVGGQSGAAWTRQRRSNGAHSDDMENPHNGASSSENIIQKVFADFAKIVQEEAVGYVPNGNHDSNDY